MFESSIHGLEFPLEDGYLYLSYDGIELIKKEPEIIDELFDFNNRPWNYKRYVASGNNGPVFFLNGEERFAVKQDKSKADIRKRLERMSVLRELTASSANEHDWIKVPAYYGGIFREQAESDFMLMDYIPCSVSLDRLMQFDGLGPISQEKVLDALKRDIDHEFLLAMQKLFYETKSNLNKLIARNGLEPEALLVDGEYWGNFLIQKDTTVSTGFNMWVIDQ